MYKDLAGGFLITFDSQDKQKSSQFFAYLVLKWKNVFSTPVAKSDLVPCYNKCRYVVHIIIEFIFF